MMREQDAPKLIGREVAMISRRIRILACLLVVFWTLGLPVGRGMAQQSMITVDGDVRLFTVLSALQAAGFGNEGNAPVNVLSLRKQVRDAIEKDLPGELRERLKQFVETHTEGANRATLISKYVSLALVMDQPPKFGYVWGKSKLPPDVLSIVEFEPMVKEFYEAVHFERIWSKAQPPLETLIARYQEPVMRSIQQTEAYLRLPSSSYLGRHYYIVIDMLSGVTGNMARNYGEDYYLVIQPSPQPDLEDLRHQFLHFVMDPLSLKYANRFYHKRALMDLVTSNPNLDPQFKGDFMLFTTECMIRAIELRLKKIPSAKIDDELTRNTVSGFFLVKHFYDQWEDFQKGDQGIRETLGDMVEAIPMEGVRKYAASLSLVKLPAPPTMPKAVKSENEKKLEEAENLLSDEKYELAKKIFQQIAEVDEGLRPRALYAMGVASSLQQNHEAAKAFFEQTLALKNIDNATKVWSRIYLGRLYDMGGERENALKEYAAAVEIGDDTRGAQAAAKRGLEKPYGMKKE